MDGTVTLGTRGTDLDDAAVGAFRRPDIEIRDRGDRAIAERKLGSEGDLGIHGHADDIRAPLVKHLGFGTGREPRSFDAHVGASLDNLQAVDLLAGFVKNIIQLGTERIGLRDVAYLAAIIKSIKPLAGAIDVLIDDDEIALVKFLAE